MNENKDCPFCGAKKAIKYVKRKEHLVPHPVDDEERIAGFDTEQSGGYYDYSHARVCNTLKHAFRSEELLAYDIEGEQMSITCVDRKPFEQYEEELKALDLRIVSINIRKEDPVFKKMEWVSQVRIERYIPNVRPDTYVVLEAESNTPAKAFMYLKHKMICGQLFRLGDAAYQFDARNQDKKIELRPVPKFKSN